MTAATDAPATPAPALDAPRSARAADPWLLATVALVVAVLGFVHAGYEFGVRDQDETVPFVLHRLDPTLFAQDWFVQSQERGFGVRTWFVELMTMLSRILPVWVAFLAVHVASLAGIAIAVYSIGVAITKDRLAGVLTALVAVVFTADWTWGSNDLLYRLLVPSMPAWVLALWGLHAFLRRRFAWSGALAGLACLMQALIGLQMAIVVGFAMAARYIRPAAGEVPRTLRPLLAFGLSFAVAGAAGLAPLVLQQFHGVAATAHDGSTAFRILTELRAAHHYQVSAATSWEFGIIALGGMVAWWLLRRRKAIAAPADIGRLLAAVALLVVLASVTARFGLAPMIVKLQFFKTTVIAKVVLCAMFCGLGPAFIPARHWNRAAGVLRYARWILILVAVGSTVAIVIAVRSGHPPAAWQRTVGRIESPTARMERWVRDHTPKDAVFAVYPSCSSFRSIAERAVVVNFQAIPYRNEEIVDWFERLTTLSGLPVPSRIGAGFREELDQHFASGDAAHFRREAVRYGFTYLLRGAPLPDPQDAFELVHAENEMLLYRLR